MGGISLGFSALFGLNPHQIPQPCETAGGTESDRQTWATFGYLTQKNSEITNTSSWRSYKKKQQVVVVQFLKNIGRSVAFLINKTNTSGSLLTYPIWLQPPNPREISSSLALELRNSTYYWNTSFKTARVCIQLYVYIYSIYKHTQLYTHYGIHQHFTCFLVGCRACTAH